jgi:hypothetical protein
MKKQFNLKIWNYLNKSIIKHEPLHKATHILLFKNQMEFFFVVLEVLNGRPQNLF